MHGTVTRRLLAAFSLCFMLLTTSCASKLQFAVIGDPIAQERIDLSVIVAEKSQVAELDDPAATGADLVNSSEKQKSYQAFAKFRGQADGVDYVWETISGPTLRVSGVKITAEGDEICVTISSKLLETVPNAVAVVVAQYNSEGWKTQLFESAVIAGGADIRLSAGQLTAIE